MSILFFFDHSLQDESCSDFSSALDEFASQLVLNYTHFNECGLAGSVGCMCACVATPLQPATW